jgi:dTDP-4-amino-4,6-dideoxygalactose transaminase
VIRLIVPYIEDDDLQAVREVLVSGHLVQGERVAAFEQAVADYVGCDYAVAVSSCTAALHMALLALDVRPRDIVLVTAYSWIATANVIELCGAKPVFVDIRPETFNMDPSCLEKELRELMADTETAERVKAILPVHTFGQMADMHSIQELASRYDLPVIEDAACALGASLNRRQAGTWGVMGCFSLHPRKAITTGEGGVIATNDSNLARRLRALRNHGQDPEASPPDFIVPGFNYRMTEFQAALGLTQMRKLDRIIASRCYLAGVYDELLQGTPLQVPVVVKGSRSVYQSYVVLLQDGAAERRDEIISRLKEQSIETTIGTLHMPMTTFFRARYGYEVGDYPVTDQIFARSLTLPLHQSLSQQEQEKVVQCLRDVGCA